MAFADPTTLPRLSTATLNSATARVVRPQYDREALTSGIVHLGLGAFVRGHLACYTEDVLARSGGADWGIVGVSLRHPDQRNRLAPQNGLYSTLQRDGDCTEARIIGCVHRIIVATEQPGLLAETMAGGACRIVSLTVTEKGYCHDPATGQLDPDNPEIAHDLRESGAPRSAIGLIVAALRRRRAEGTPPFTVLCCDNLPHNGRLLAGLVQDFAAAAGDDGLAGWIHRNVAFPGTMVDRIVPAMTGQDIADAGAALGLHDAAPVSHEPFRQWVIEDRFGPSGRPAWEQADAQMVSDVAPFEHMKLRLLNGAHSALAYLGYLAGHETIPDVMADDVFVRYLRRLWDEILPAVASPPAVDLIAYTLQLAKRFGNSAVRHRTWQIAMDGSQKLPQRLLSTVRECLADGRPIRCLALAIAGWIRYVGGIDERGQVIDVRDPLATLLRATLEQAGSLPRDRVIAALGFQSVFGTDLPHTPQFTEAVVSAYQALLQNGARTSASMIVVGT